MRDDTTLIDRTQRWGLCATCVHARVIESDKGSAFVQCGLAKEDPRYRKYPHVPVVRCGGWAPK
mgnify:FL=1